MSRRCLVKCNLRASDTEGDYRPMRIREGMFARANSGVVHNCGHLVCTYAISFAIANATDAASPPISTVCKALRIEFMPVNLPLM